MKKQILTTNEYSRFFYKRGWYSVQYVWKTYTSETWLKLAKKALNNTLTKCTQRSRLPQIHRNMKETVK